MRQRCRRRTECRRRCRVLGALDGEQRGVHLLGKMDAVDVGRRRIAGCGDHQDCRQPRRRQCAEQIVCGHGPEGAGAPQGVSGEAAVTHERCSRAVFLVEFQPGCIIDRVLEIGAGDCVECVVRIVIVAFGIPTVVIVGECQQIIRRFVVTQRGQAGGQRLPVVRGIERTPYGRHRIVIAKAA